MAAFRPSCASEITSLRPARPRLTRPRRKSVQNTSASEGPICRPTISRRPSVFTATATIAATETMRPPCRTFRPDLQVSGIQPERGPLTREGPLQEGSDTLVDLLTELGHGRLRDTRQAHRRHQVVHAPGRDAGDPRLLDPSWITATSAFSAV